MDFGVWPDFSQAWLVSESPYAFSSHPLKIKREKDFVDPGDTLEPGAGALPTEPEMNCTAALRQMCPLPFGHCAQNT